MRRVRSASLAAFLAMFILSGCLGAGGFEGVRATAAAIRAEATAAAMIGPGSTPTPTFDPATEGFGGGAVETQEPATLDIFDSPLDEQPTPEPAQWWRVYFTTPGQEENHIAQELIALIDAAQSSIHIASFEFNLDEVADALIAAHERGVEVLWVTDDEHGMEADEEEGHGQFARMEAAGIEIHDDGRSGLMHDKFWIFDSQIVWTGSTNITHNGTLLNNNNVIVLDSPETAMIYELEFLEMWAGEFGVRSTSTAGTQGARVDGTPLWVFFGAEDNVAAQLTRLIESAEFSIQFMAFSFTQDDMGQAIIEQYENGVDVAGIFETRGSETAFSEMPQMFCVGIPVRQDGNPRTFHHKVLIIDNTIVATGSFNFSNNADKSNDENVLIIANEDIAFMYMLEFEQRWQEGIEPTAGEDVICE